MGKAREFADRRKSVKNTRKITHTMEMVSTAKFKQAMDRAVATRPYRNKLTEMLSTLASAVSGSGHKLLERRAETKRASILVISSNRGLCGGYNSNVLRLATESIREWNAAKVEVDLHVSGKRGLIFFDYMKLPIAARYTAFADKPTYADVLTIADTLIGAYERGETDKVSVAWMEFHSVSRQTPRVHQLLPIEQLAPAKGSATDSHHKQGEVIFDPDPQSILEELLPLYVRTSFFSAFLDAVVSEHIARMIAMKSATDAAEDMIKLLTRAYNRARQGQITNEIAEIVGGAAAL